MATFDELFSSSAGQRYMKFNEAGEVLLLVQTGEPRLVAQKNQQTGKTTWLVKFTGAAKYKPMDEDTFDPDGEDVENAFMPNKNVVIPVRVVAKKLRDGSKDENFEAFDTDWELSVDQREKFKEAMLDSETPAVVGTKYAVKLLSKDSKPYKYSIKMQAGE